ncbi:MAG: RluA family pseudouridine synthase [Peptococcaceae bacterium]|nr:RluA family pseudouridine synthase [Peptococcaceae bacterium]
METIDFYVGHALVPKPHNPALLTEQESRGFAGQRLDKALAALSGHSRAMIQNLIRGGHARVNNQPASPHHLLKQGDHIHLDIPQDPLPGADMTRLKILPENIPLDIIHEDQSLLVVNKPQGMVVHPAPGTYRGTLVNALLYHCPKLSGVAGTVRPGIVHRLDKDTSGLLLVAKTDDAHHALARQIQAHSLERLYRAILHGVFYDAGATIDAPIGRDPHDRRKRVVQIKSSGTRQAMTHIEVLQRFENFTEIKATLETGRLHQIRVHMAWLGHPVVGDPFYGPNPSFRDLKGQLLHAERIGFAHPDTGKTMGFEAPPPLLYQEVLKELRNTHHATV